MRFFNIDLHISTISDIADIFKCYGHEVTDWSISNHTWVMHRTRANIPLLENNGWQYIIENKLWDAFYDTYKDELKDYDCFISCYAPYFAMLYQRFEKPIIINTPIRYEHPLSFRPEQWEIFNEFIRKGIDNGTLIFVANNVMDKKYAEGFIGREVLHIPSLCEYTRIKYKSSDNPYVYCSRNTIDGLKGAEPLPRNLPGNFPQLQFRGIIHIPYQISTMSIFEAYTANMPLFFPSLDFLMTLYQENRDILKEVSWNNLFNKPANSFIPFKGQLDPNNYTDPESVRYWCSMADFYDKQWMPDTILFNSIEELNDLLNTIDPTKQSLQMSYTNILRKKRIYDLWLTVLDKIGAI